MLHFGLEDCLVGGILSNSLYKGKILRAAAGIKPHAPLRTKTRCQ